jgi:tRNA(Ile)-lysidine synthase
LKDRFINPESNWLDDNNNSEYFIYEGTKDVKIPLNLSFSKVDDIYIPTNTAIFVDENKLVFPLALRRWEGIVFNLLWKASLRK